MKRGHNAIYVWCSVSWVGDVNSRSSSNGLLFLFLNLLLFSLISFVFLGVIRMKSFSFLNFLPFTFGKRKGRSYKPYEGLREVMYYNGPLMNMRRCIYFL